MVVVFLLPLFRDLLFSLQDKPSIWVKPEQVEKSIIEEFNGDHKRVHEVP